MLLTSRQAGVTFVSYPSHHHVKTLASPFSKDIRFYIANGIGVGVSPRVITCRLHHIINMTTTAVGFSEA